MALNSLKVNNSTVTNVDNKPAINSNNLIKSGGVDLTISKIKRTILLEDCIVDGYIMTDGQLHFDEYWRTTDYINIEGISSIFVNLVNVDNVVVVEFSNNLKVQVDLINGYNLGVEKEIIIPEGVTYFRASFNTFDPNKNDQYIKFGELKELSEKVDKLENNLNGNNTKEYKYTDGIYQGFLYSTNNGELYNDPNFKTIDYISVKNDYKLLVNLYNVDALICVVFYNNEKEIISIDNSYSSLVPKEIFVPRNASYFRASFNTFDEYGPQDQYVKYYKKNISQQIDEIKSEIHPISKWKKNYDFYNIIDPGIDNSYTNYTIDEDGLLINFTNISEKVKTKEYSISLELYGEVECQVTSSNVINVQFMSSEQIGLRLNSIGIWAQIYRNNVELLDRTDIPSFAIGDILRLTVIRYYEDIICIIRNLTKGLEYSLCYEYNYYTYPPQGSLPLTTAKLAVYIENNDLLIKKMRFINKRWERTPTTVIFGDSLSSMCYSGQSGNSQNARENCWQFVAFGTNNERQITLSYPGASTTLMLSYIQECIDLNPQYVVIFLGTNNYLQEVSPITTKYDIIKMVEILMSAHIIPIIMGLLPIHGAIRTEYNDVLQSVANKYGLTYIDPNIAVTTGMMVDDEVHLNLNGHHTLGQLFASVVPSSVLS